MKMVTVNGKQYPAKDITYNFFCNLEEKGLNFQEMENKPFLFIRDYIAFCMDAPDVVAGDAIDAHISNGGNFEELVQTMSEAIENSGFFRAQQTTAKQTTPKSESKSEEKE